MIKHNDNHYLTSDFCLASTLISLGFSVSVFDKNNPKRIVFHFNNSPELHQAVSDYWDNGVKVTPREFYSAQRELKNRMYSD